MDPADLPALRTQLALALRSIQALSTTTQLWRAPVIQPADYAGENGAEVPGLKFFEGSVRREIDTFDRVIALADGTRQGQPFSTNAPYYLAVWSEILRAPPPILSIGKNFSLPRHKARGKSSVKVDVVADDGRQWIRVNTIKNARLLSELREVDSYVSPSSSSSSPSSSSDEHPTSASRTTAPAFAAPRRRRTSALDNSVLRMARSLLDAAAHNPLPGGGGKDVPRVHMRLTRLDPGAGAGAAVSDGGENTEAQDQDGAPDPRIAETVRRLRALGIVVHLGSPSLSPSPSNPSASLSATGPCAPPAALRPTRAINLDLSLLIALISDLTHAPLPGSEAEAAARFRPFSRVRKEQAGSADAVDIGTGTPERDQEGADGEGEYSDHSRALLAQLEQEMRTGLLEEMHRVLFPAGSELEQGQAQAQAPVQFWTTDEAKRRCLSIIGKIGGPAERRRAAALFVPASDSVTGTGAGMAGDAPAPDMSAFWEGSRYPAGYLPGLPIRISSPSSSSTASPMPSEPFLARLAHTCRSILAPVAHHAAPAPYEAAKPVVPHLTAHTVRSFLQGALEGRTTLTANKMSIRAIMREMRSAEVAGAGAGAGVGGSISALAPSVTDGEERAGHSVSSAQNTAWIWVVEPRSLAEGMRTDSLG